MSEPEKNVKTARHSCTARVDRLQVLSWAPPRRKPPAIAGFQVTRDTFIRRQTSTKTYARCRHYASLRNGAKIYWQYDRQKGWLKPWKVTLVADDNEGLSRAEIESVLMHCRFHRFLLVEVALDFTLRSRVNQAFVRRHAIFGKSRPRVAAPKTQVLYYGGRKSGKLVRIYQKDSLKVFRVELELHSNLLWQHGIQDLDNLIDLPLVIHPQHFRFVDFDWEKLRRYLITRMGQRGHAIVAAAQRRATSIHRVAGYLREKKVLNTHRFLLSLRLNKDMVSALENWAMWFEGEALS